MKKKVVAVLLMVSIVAALAIGCGSKKEGGSEKNEGTTEKTKYEQIINFLFSNHDITLFSSKLQ